MFLVYFTIRPYEILQPLWKSELVMAFPCHTLVFEAKFLGNSSNFYPGFSLKSFFFFALFIARQLLINTTENLTVHQYKSLLSRTFLIPLHASPVSQEQYCAHIFDLDCKLPRPRVATVSHNLRLTT